MALRAQYKEITKTNLQEIFLRVIYSYPSNNSQKQEGQGVKYSITILHHYWGIILLNTVHYKFYFYFIFIYKDLKRKLNVNISL